MKGSHGSQNCRLRQFGVWEFGEKLRTAICHSGLDPESRFKLWLQMPASGYRLGGRLRHYAFAPLRICASTPLRLYASAPLRICATTHLRHYATTHLHHYATTPLRLYASAPLRLCASAPLRPYAFTRYALFRFTFAFFYDRVIP